MTKNPRQHKKVSTSSKPVHRKGVAKGVGREADAGNGQLLPEYLEIPFKVPNGDLRIVLCAKEIPPVSLLYYKTPKRFPELEAKGYKPMLTAFPQYFTNHVVEIDLFFRKSKNLTRSQSAVKNRKSNKVGTTKINPGWAMLEKAQDLIMRKRR